MFFTKHPFITQTDNNGNSVQVTDILATLTGFDIYKNSQYSIQYYIREGDTPESIALRLYNKQSYSWIILLINGMKGVYTDWPLSSNYFDAYTKKKYEGLSSIFFKLDSIQNYDIKPGDLITVVNNTNIAAEVVSWNASLSKLTIRQIKGTFSPNQTVYIFNTDLDGNRIVDYADIAISLLETGTTPKIIIGDIARVNLYEQDSLHHFESNGVYIDPLTGYLQGYLAGVDNNVVTNYEYEVKQNDNKRYIYLPTPEVAIRIEQEYAKLMAV